MIQSTHPPIVVNLHYTERLGYTLTHGSWGAAGSDLQHCNGAKCFTSRQDITILSPPKDFLVARRNKLGLPPVPSRSAVSSSRSQRSTEKKRTPKLFDVYSFGNYSNSHALSIRNQFQDARIPEKLSDIYCCLLYRDVENQ